MATGFEGRAWAKAGCAIFLAERRSWTDSEIVAVFAGIAGQNGVKPETWYTLKNGQLTEIAA